MNISEFSWKLKVYLSLNLIPILLPGANKLVSNVSIIFLSVDMVDLLHNK